MEKRETNREAYLNTTYMKRIYGGLFFLVIIIGFFFCGNESLAEELQKKRMENRILNKEMKIGYSDVKDITEVSVSYYKNNYLEEYNDSIILVEKDTEEDLWIYWVPKQEEMIIRVGKELATYPWGWRNDEIPQVLIEDLNSDGEKEIITTSFHYKESYPSYEWELMLFEKDSEGTYQLHTLSEETIEGYPQMNVTYLLGEVEDENFVCFETADNENSYEVSIGDRRVFGFLF